MIENCWLFLLIIYFSLHLHSHLFASAAVGCVVCWCSEGQDWCAPVSRCCHFLCRVALDYSLPSTACKGCTPNAIIVPRHPGLRIAIHSLLLTLSFWVEFFLCADMFPCEDSTIASVCTSRTIFVNISPTLLIDTSMERSSRVLQHVEHGNPIVIWICFQKSSNFDFWRRAEITLATSISVLH